MGSNPVGGCSFCNIHVTIKSLFCNNEELNVTLKKLLVGESNPGRERDRLECYQLHQPGNSSGGAYKRGAPTGIRARVPTK